MTLPPIAVIADAHRAEIAADPGAPGVLSGGRTLWLRPPGDTATAARAVNESPALFEAAMARIAARGIRHVVLLGDWTDAGQVRALAGLRARLGHWRARAGIAFHAVPGNHDMWGASGKHSATRIMAPDGGTRLLTSDPALAGTEADAILCPGLRIPGQAQALSAMADCGFFRRPGDLHWESPFGPDDRLSARLHTLRARDGSVTHRLIDASCLIEPAAGLWLLMLDANLWEPRPGIADPARKRAFLDPTDAGWTAVLAHRPYLLDWIADVARRARAGGKVLVALSHYPAADPFGPLGSGLGHAGHAALARRAPAPAVAAALASAGLTLHLSGHLHARGEARAGAFRDVAIPSPVAWPPGFAILHPAEGRVEQVSLADVPAAPAQPLPDPPPSPLPSPRGGGAAHPPAAPHGAGHRAPPSPTVGEGWEGGAPALRDEDHRPQPQPGPRPTPPAPQDAANRASPSPPAGQVRGSGETAPRDPDHDPTPGSAALPPPPTPLPSPRGGGAAHPPAAPHGAGDHATPSSPAGEAWGTSPPRPDAGKVATAHPGRAPAAASTPANRAPPSPLAEEGGAEPVPRNAAHGPAPHPAPGSPPRAAQDPANRAPPSPRAGEGEAGPASPTFRDAAHDPSAHPRPRSLPADRHDPANRAPPSPSEGEGWEGGDPACGHAEHGPAPQRGPGPTPSAPPHPTVGDLLRARARARAVRHHLPRDWPPGVAALLSRGTLADLAAALGALPEAGLSAIPAADLAADWHVLRLCGSADEAAIPAARRAAYARLAAALPPAPDETVAPILRALARTPPGG